MIATYEQVEPPDDKKEAEALDLQPARNRNTGLTGKLPEKNIKIIQEPDSEQKHDQSMTE